MYDLIIVGLGAAGISAAIYAKRSNLKVLCLEKGMPGGIINYIDKIDNYPGFPNISGADLSYKLYEHLMSLDIEYKLESVNHIEKDQDIFNIIFNKHISIIDYKWNIDVYNLKEKGESKTTSKAKDKAYENPSLVHCMGSRKWWTWEGLPFGEEWDSYNKTMRINGRNTFKVLSNGIVVVTRR